MTRYQGRLRFAAVVLAAGSSTRMRGSHKLLEHLDGQLLEIVDAFDHVRVRVQTWWDPFADPDGAGYQMVQSLFSFATGGIFGTGLGNGQPGTIPAASTWRRRFARFSGVVLSGRSPKSASFRVPPGVTSTFPGFRSRWMILCSWSRARPHNNVMVTELCSKIWQFCLQNHILHHTLIQELPSFYH